METTLIIFLMLLTDGLDSTSSICIFGHIPNGKRLAKIIFFLLGAEKFSSTVAVIVDNQIKSGDGQKI